MPNLVVSKTTWALLEDAGVDMSNIVLNGPVARGGLWYWSIELNRYVWEPHDVSKLTGIPDNSPEAPPIPPCAHPLAWRRYDSMGKPYCERCGASENSGDEKHG